MYRPRGLLLAEVVDWELKNRTSSDNIQDCIRKERHKPCPGEANGFAKLTDDAVAYIRSSNETAQEMANRYGVSIYTINSVRCGRSWKHLL